MTNKTTKATKATKATKSTKSLNIEEVEHKAPVRKEIPDVIILQDNDELMLPPEAVMWGKSCCC